MTDLEKIHSGEWEVRWMVFRPSWLSGEVGYFHFFNKVYYDSPQFGDAYHAKLYLTKAAALARCRPLNKDGYEVIAIKELRKVR